jgi:addiction module HigA family antidote
MAPKDMINEYQPDFVTPPGDSLADILETIEMTQAELARRTGRSLKTINEIIKGKAPVTPETSLQFEKVLGVKASFWNNREKYYRAYLALQKEKKSSKSSGMVKINPGSRSDKEMPDCQI